jgi:hypothetical protein
MSEPVWTSEPVEHEGVTITVSVTEDGFVDLGKTIEGVYASDLLMPATQSDQVGRYLIEGAARSLAMRK